MIETVLGDVQIDSPFDDRRQSPRSGWKPLLLWGPFCLIRLPLRGGWGLCLPGAARTGRCRRGFPGERQEAEERLVDCLGGRKRPGDTIIEQHQAGPLDVAAEILPPDAAPQILVTSEK